MQKKNQQQGGTASLLCYGVGRVWIMREQATAAAGNRFDRLRSVITLEY